MIRVDWKDRKPTWRYDWLWLISYVVIVVGFLTWTVAWRGLISFDEMALLVLGLTALNIVRGLLIMRAFAKEKAHD